MMHSRLIVLVGGAACTLSSACLAAQPTMPPRPGYYAMNSTCQQAMASRDNGVVVTKTHLEDIDGDYALLPVRHLGSGQYALGDAFESLRQVSPNSYVDSAGKDHERRLHWCAAKPPRG